MKEKLAKLSMACNESMHITKQEKKRRSKMNKDLLALKMAVLDYGTEFYSLVEQKAKLDETYNTGYISKNTYDAQSSQIQAAQDALKGKALAKVNAAEKAYKTAVTEWAVLDGSKLNQEDIALLNSGINLKNSDYAQLEEKYLDNYSMLRAIYDTSKKQNVTFNPSASIDLDEKIQEFNKVVTMAKSILHAIGFEKNVEPTSDYGYRLWALEGSFESIFADLDKIIAV